MPVYFIRSEQVHQGEIVIMADLAHHLHAVLRCKVGEELFLVDEQPIGYLAEVTQTAPACLTLKIKKEISPSQEKTAQIHLGIAILKGDHMDWALQKATELGVQRISPLVTARCVVAIKPERQSHQLNRWRNIVKEAAQQSGRWSIPIIDSPCQFSEFIGQPAREGFQFIFWEEANPNENQLALSAQNGSILIGPEGGWDRSEVNLAVNQGYQVRSLGRRILRAETAAVAALSIIQYEFEQEKR